MLVEEDDGDKGGENERSEQKLSLGNYLYPVAPKFVLTFRFTV